MAAAGTIVRIDLAGVVLKGVDDGTGLVSLLTAQADKNGIPSSSTNTSLVGVASAAYTTAQTALVTNTNGHAVDVIVDITAIGATTLTVTIDAQDPASLKWYNLLTSVALGAVSTTVLRVGPTLTAAANQAANLWVPRTFRVVATPSNATAITYSVGVNVNE